MHTRRHDMLVVRPLRQTSRQAVWQRQATCGDDGERNGSDDLATLFLPPFRRNI